MRRRLSEIVVAFLSFSNSDADALKAFSRRDWERALQWLDDAGLSFYFLQKLKDAEARDFVPTWVVSRLEGNYYANQQRMDHMSNYFDRLNRKFKEAGIRYAAIKGFSLVPEFCPIASLRHQSDLDYLVRRAIARSCKANRCGSRVQTERFVVQVGVDFCHERRRIPFAEFAAILQTGAARG